MPMTLRGPALGFGIGLLFLASLLLDDSIKPSCQGQPATVTSVNINPSGADWFAVGHYATPDVIVATGTNDNIVAPRLEAEGQPAGGSPGPGRDTGPGDLICGNDDPNVIYLGANQTVETIYANGGDDLIYGGGGDEIVYGGNGEDAVWFYKGGGELDMGPGIKDHVFVRSIPAGSVIVYHESEGEDHLHLCHPGDLKQIVFPEGEPEYIGPSLDGRSACTNQPSVGS